MTEMPQMASLQYSSNTFTPGSSATGGWTASNTIGAPVQVTPNFDFLMFHPRVPDYDTKLEEDDEMTDTPTRRLVKVFMVDPDENIPLNKCLLHRGDEQLTDLTDEELFFEIPVKELLDKHNKERVKVKKETTGGRKTEYLKKARIRDLRMTVVTIAQF